jgi:hypothetical protein
VTEIGCRADLAVFDLDVFATRFGVFATRFTVAGGSAVAERAGRLSWDVSPSGEGGQDE